MASHTTEQNQRDTIVIRSIRLSKAFGNDNGAVSEARGSRLRSVTGECVKGFLSRRELNQPAGGSARLIVPVISRTPCRYSFRISNGVRRRYVCIDTYNTHTGAWCRTFRWIGFVLLSIKSKSISRRHFFWPTQLQHADARCIDYFKELR